jgi:hypothetical protein
VYYTNRVWLQVLVVKTKGIDCSMSDEDVGNIFDLAYNELFNGGCYDKNHGLCWIYSQSWSQKKIKQTLEGHCKETKADMVFMFLTGGLFLATALLLLLKQRRG